MWYFQFNNQQNGPNDSEVIEALLAKQTLSRDTLVWKEGMNDWCRLVDTELASLIPKNLPPPIKPAAGKQEKVQVPLVQTPPIQSGSGQPTPIRKTGFQIQINSEEIQPVLTPKGLWLWSIILYLAGFVFLFME